MKRLLPVLLLCLMSSGCLSWRPIFDHGSMVKTAFNQPTLEQVRDAILLAGEDKRIGGSWIMKEAAPGHIVAAIIVRNTYKVAVDIHYTQTEFKMTYKDSENMYHAGPLIHRKYNGWVKNLEKSIQRELYKI